APALSDGQARVVGGVWAFRARLEETAVARFSRLGERLESVGAQPEVLALARKAVGDERRHAALCADMANAYGGPAEGSPPREGRCVPEAVKEAGYPALVAHGELPRQIRAELFEATAREVIFPGLERAGVDTAPARACLRELVAGSAQHP